MTIGLKVDFLLYEIGTPQFLHSFFSTICYNLENEKWGSEFPIFMGEFYQGDLSFENVKKALEELKTIHNLLKECSIHNVVWDIEDLTKQPPWGDNISSDITDLSNYFITSDGRGLIDVIYRVFLEALSEKQSVKIVTI